ncbi:MAG: PD40 domain-containing protein [Deltaproteobacteria bacterium]|nr:PD40 domain-containing protein [Deltaproteobacteria bacterium]
MQLRTLGVSALLAGVVLTSALWTPVSEARRPARAPEVSGSVGFSTLAPDLAADSPNSAVQLGELWALMSHSPSPSWSPDGKRFALHDAYCVSVVRRDGSIEKTLRAPEQMYMEDTCRHPRWSPSGKELVVSGSFYGESWRMDRRDRWVKPVVARGQGIWGASYSPDGRWILGRTPQTGAVVLPVEGTGVAHAVATAQEPSMGAYFTSLSPDGRHAARVLGEHGEAGVLELFQIDLSAAPIGVSPNPWPTLDTGGDYPARLGQRMLTLPGVVPEYAWSADGNSLVAVTETSWYPAYEEYNYPEGPLVLVDLRAGTSRNLGLTGINPTLSPDGQWVAFAREGVMGIWVAPTDGSGAARLLHGFGTEPLWSPDGSRMLVYDVPSAWAEVLTLREG